MNPKHIIKEYNWRSQNPIDDYQTIRERKFNRLFSESSLKWFEGVCIKRYRRPRKILDNTLAGFHFEIGDLVIELH